MSVTKFVPALRYKSLTGLYDFFLRITFPEKKIKQALIDQCSFKTDERILDFGIGTATLSLMIKQQFPSINITGIDVDSKILEIAKNKVKGNVNLLQYDGSHIPLPDESIDKILSSLVFHHIATANKKIVLKELYRVLKPGGEFHIADFGKANNLYSKLAFGIFRRIDGEENTRINAMGLLPSFISDAGFSDTQETTNFNTAFGTVVLIKATKHEPEPFSNHTAI